MVDALHCLDFDTGFLVAGIGVGQDQQRLRAVGDVEAAVEAHRLDAALLASRFVESVGERDGLVVDLVREVRRKQRDRQRNGRLDLHVEFLAIVVGSHQAVDLGRRCDLVFFVQDAAPLETGLHAIVHARPAEVLDVEIVGVHELSDARSEDCSDRRDDGLFGPALVVEGDDHRPFGRKMTLINCVGHMLLHTEKAEIRRCSRVLYRGVPFVGPHHGHGDRISGIDLHVHVAASGSRMVDTAGMQAGGLQRNRFAVGRSPVEHAIVLRRQDGGEAADEHRGKDREVPHPMSICPGKCAHLGNSRRRNYGSTRIRSTAALRYV